MRKSLYNIAYSHNPHYVHLPGGFTFLWDESLSFSVFAEPLPDSASELVKQAVRDRWAIYSLRSGLESLPRAIHAALLEREVEVHLDRACTALHFSGNSVQVRVGIQYTTLAPTRMGRATCTHVNDNINDMHRCITSYYMSVPTYQPYPATGPQYFAGLWAGLDRVSRSCHYVDHDCDIDYR